MKLEDLEADCKGNIGKVREEVKTHSYSIAELKVSMCKKDVEIEELRLETTMGLLKGFVKAKDQVQFLYPDLDLSLLSVYKVISDGELVEMSSSGEEEPDATMADAEGGGDVSSPIFRFCYSQVL